MPIGQLNRKITIQKKVKSTNLYGEKTFTWADYSTPFAKVTFKKGDEKYDSEKLIAENEVEFTIRKHPTKKINEELSVVYENHRYDITYIKEEGIRPQYLVLTSNKNTLINIDTWLLTEAFWNDDDDWVDSETWVDLPSNIGAFNPIQFSTAFNIA